MYSIEIKYELENPIKMTIYEFKKNYLEIIKKEKEVKSKDKILTTYADKYNGILNSHDFDTAMEKNEQLDDFKNIPIVAFCRNMNFIIESHKILDFVKNLDNNFDISFIKKYEENNDYTIFNKDTHPDSIHFDNTDKLVYKACLTSFIANKQKEKNKDKKD